MDQCATLESFISSKAFKWPGFPELSQLGCYLDYRNGLPFKCWWRTVAEQSGAFVQRWGIIDCWWMCVEVSSETRCDLTRFSHNCLGPARTGNTFPYSLGGKLDHLLAGAISHSDQGLDIKLLLTQDQEALFPWKRTRKIRGTLSVGLWQSNILSPPLSSVKTFFFFSLFWVHLQFSYFT